MGNDNVDKDHRKLLKIYNDLVDLIEYNRSREEFSRILSQMSDYSIMHFKKEEEYMMEFNYPDIDAHKQSHMDYIYRVSMFNVELSRFRTTDPQDVIKFLETWWVKHIMEKDASYEKYRKSINSSAKYKEF